MKVKKIIIFFLVISGLLWAPLYVSAEDNPAENIETTVSETTDTFIFTEESFAELSDDEKKDIYFNYSEMLPENFDPVQYGDIFHPEE